MSQYFEMLSPVIKEYGSAIAIVAGAVFVSKSLRRVIEHQRNANRFGVKTASRLHHSRRWVVTVLAGILLLDALGVIDSAWAILSTTLAALAVGFIAAWSVLSNATAALLVIVFRPYRLGDDIELVEPNGNAIGGRVLNLNLMYTTLRVPAAGHETDEAGQASATNTTATTEKGQGNTVLRIPNNLVFQKMLRVRSPHDWDSHATFFWDDD